MKTLFFDSANGGRAMPMAAKGLSFVMALTFLCSLVLTSFASLQYDWDWEAVARYRTKFWQGWLTTLVLSAAALLLSILIGGAAALTSRSRFLPLRYLAGIYIEATRGTPLLVQILIYYYVFADSIQIQNRYAAGIVILSLFSGAYIAEIFRSGIQSVGQSQILSAKAIGLAPAQIFRFVVAPQALRHSLPALAGQFANLIKDSSLLSIIAIGEFTLNAQEVNSATLSSFESFLPLALGYLLLTLPIMQLARRLEAKLAFET